MPLGRRRAAGRAAPAAVLAALLGLAGCGGGGGGAGPVASSPPAGPGSAPAAGSTSPGASAPGSAGGTGRSDAAGAALTLAFGGDVHFARQLGALLDDPQESLAELRPLLGAADLAVVNLETAITDRGVEQPKTYHFRAPASALQAVAGAGVDVVTMANNHAVDYGPDGLVDSLAAACTSPVPVVGLGADEASAYAPAVLTAKGRRVAVLAATQVPDGTSAHFGAQAGAPGVALALDPARLARAVREARSSADVVVVYLHWGTDYTGCPNPLQERTARLLAQAGADVVVGAHAHRVQGGGWLGGTYVSYGLGNFVWYVRNSPEESATGVLTLTLDGRRVVAERWTPLQLSADGVPRPPAAARAAQQSADREQARGCAHLTAAPS